jgi:hypothetical protein
VEPTLKAGPDASPPDNMRNALILQAAILGALLLFLIPFKGEQHRRADDEAQAHLAQSVAKVYGIPIQDGVDAHESDEFENRPQFIDPYQA